MVNTDDQIDGIQWDIPPSNQTWQAGKSKSMEVSFAGNMIEVFFIGGFSNEHLRKPEGMRWLQPV